ncbi:MAG: hypothetical protein U5L09_19190 [Bacteroidales bacterium]|nr:hypothetical protein [Bacteroidales bacterium]
MPHLKMPERTTYEVSARNLDEGVYYVVFRAGNTKTTKKLVVVK